jgi:hypothetical protein
MNIVIKILVVALASPLLALAQNTPSGSLSMLQEMSLSVSNHYAGLMKSINSRGSLTLPPAFESLLALSPNNSSFGSMLLRSMQFANSTNSSSSNENYSLLDSSTMLLDPVQAGIIASSLGVASQAAGLASAISYTVSGGIGTIATSLSVGLASIGTLTGPAALLISETQFASTLYNDVETNTDLLTVASDKIMSLLQSINFGGTNKTLKTYLSQLQTASNLLQAATKRFSNL